MALVSARTGAMCGVAAAAGWTALYLVAALGHPSYSMTENFLSDLGDYVRSPNAWAFNLACLLAGVLAVPFAWTLGSTVGGLGGRVGRVTLVLAAVALAGVGVFPERSPYSLHTISAFGFFLLLTASQGAFIVPAWKFSGFRPFGGPVTAAAFAISVVMIALLVPPIAEHIGVFAALVWLVFLAGLLWRTSVRADTRASAAA